MSVPSGRSLAGWWRDLAPLRPHRLWFSHLLLHRIDALVEDEAPAAADVLGRAFAELLRARPGADPASLAAELRLDPALARAALAGGGATTGRRQRRSFRFTEGAYHFLPLADPACSPLMPPAGWTFDLARLAAAAASPGGWRRDNGFPADVRRLLLPPDLTEPERARAVAVDHAEQAPLALLLNDGGLLGFAVTTETGELRQPAALALPAGSDFAAAIAAPLADDAWRQAWVAWCQQRSLPTAEVEASRLEPAGHRLIVRAPARLVERLRQGRSEALRGEAWLLAGAGRVRAAAQVEFAG